MRNWYSNRRHCHEQGLAPVKMTNDMINQGLYFDELLSKLPEDIFQDIPNEQRHLWLAGRAVDLSKWTFINESVAMGKNINFQQTTYLPTCG